eukprot:359322-Prymnesium_polylepis.1
MSLSSYVYARTYPNPVRAVPLTVVPVHVGRCFLRRPPMRTPSPSVRLSPKRGTLPSAHRPTGAGTSAPPPAAQAARWSRHQRGADC